MTTEQEFFNQVTPGTKVNFVTYTTKDLVELTDYPEKYPTLNIYDGTYRFIKLIEKPENLNFEKNRVILEIECLTNKSV